MTKKIFLTALCALALCPAFAQTSGTEEKVEYSTDKYKVETNSFWDNTFVSLGVGGNIYFGDHDKQVDFGKRLAPAFDIAVGVVHSGHRRARDVQLPEIKGCHAGCHFHSGTLHG